MKLSPRYDGPVILTIDGEADDQLAPLTRQRRRMEAMLAELTEDEWGTASRCDGWTVQDVVAHLASANGFWESSVRLGLAGTPGRVLAAFDPVAHPPMLIAPMQGLTPRETLDQLVASNDGLLEAVATLDDGGWSSLSETPAGHVPIRLLAFHALWDSWVHERDVAIPLGRPTVAEPDELASCLRYAAALGPALSIGTPHAFTGELGVHATDPEVRFTLDAGESVAVHDASPSGDAPCLRGPSVELVEALSLRVALPAATPPEWHDLVGSLATTFETDLEPSR